MAGEARRKRLRRLLATAGHPEGDLAAFDAAFVHESATAETPATVSNERLEFVGDAIFGSIVARSLFTRYGEASEGELHLRKAALVSDVAVSTTARRLGFEELLILGAGLANAAPARRFSALGDAFEAFVAVLHREAGDDVASAFVLREHVLPSEAAGGALEDPKNVLQEWLQRRGLATPTYVDSFEGPDHERTFHAEVVVDGSRASGSGPSKKAAQRAAAAAMVASLAQRYDDLGGRTLSTASEASAPRPKRVRRGTRASVQNARAATAKTSRS